MTKTETRFVLEPMEASRNRAVAKPAMLGAVALVALIAWLIWAWQDNKQLLSQAEAQWSDGDFHQAQVSLESLHGGIVPADEDAVMELTERIQRSMVAADEAAAVALADANAKVIAEEAPVAVAEEAPVIEETRSVEEQNPAEAEAARIQAANEHALSHGRVLVLVDPLPWVEALQDPTPEQVAEGQALLARNRFGIGLKAQWPTPAFPNSLHLQMLDIELAEAELVSTFNQLALAHGWATIVTDPAPVIKALRTPSPEQRTEGALLTARHKISAALLPRWIEPALSKPVLDVLRNQEITPVEIDAQFLSLAQSTMSQKVEQLAVGPWTKATNSASANGALTSAKALLEQLPKPGLTEAEVADITKRITVIQTEATAAAKARGAVEAKLAAEILAKENTERNPFEAQGWTIVDRTLGHGGFAKKLKDPKTGIVFALIAPGEYQMGSPAAELEREADEIQRKVKIDKAFYLGITEVTQAQWRKVMPSNPNPSHFNGSKLPVDSVSWNDCQEFLAAAGSGYRLPTEREWEYACRAGTLTPFSWGALITNAQANLDGRARYGEGAVSGAHIKTIAAGSLPANPWGLHDMHGNVWEWCSDWYGSDTSAPEGAGTERVLRGGSWINGPRYCRAANRFMQTPDTRQYVNGFRVVYDLPEAP